MSILRFTLAQLPQAMAVLDPKFVAIDASGIRVFTGPDIPANLVDDPDKEAARSYAKLRALAAMSPAQVQAWVGANVTTLAQAQDAIATLAIAVSVLARSL